MNFEVGDVVQHSTWGPIVLFEVVGFLDPPTWKAERDVSLRVVWKRYERDLPAWPIGTTTCSCVSMLLEPDNAMLAIAVSASLETQ
jgi:hypothetical protein